MATQTLAESPSIPPVPREIQLAAIAIPLTILPSVFWRLGATLSIPGFGLQNWDGISAGEVIYIQSLNVVSLALGLLALGFVKRWGRVLPDWIPLVGGRAVPPLLPVIPAVALGTLWAFSAVMIFLLGVTIFETEGQATDIITSLQTETLMSILYFPLVATGPLAVVVALWYYFRRPRKTRD